MAEPVIGATLIELRNVSKRFGGTQALDNVSLEVRAGEIHAFVGENGAGKSTLGKVIAGIYAADQGEVLVDDVSVERWNPALAQRHGVAMIAQELALVPDLTVAQNVFLGAEEQRFGFERRNLSERFLALDAEVGFGLDPRAKVRGLRIADQQKVEILRSLARNARVIVMDEPTSSLAAKEMAQLEALMRTLRDRGCCVVYVSHFLDSVLSVADRITVMRDGRRVSTVATSEVTKHELVTAMLGRELDGAYPERPSAPDRTAAPLLRVANARTSTGVEGMSFEVRPGEIVGLLGLVGSGRTECLRAVFGVDELSGGEVVYQGADWARKKPKDSIAAGLIFVSEDRHRDGLVLERSVRENIALASLGKRAAAGVISTRAEKSVALGFASALQIRPLDIELPVGWFSGGNQQKALLSKALAADPKVIILDEPTRGVDVGAKRTIYELIVRLAQEGIGVVLISSEHEEIMELAHRAYLVSEGRTFGEIVPEETTVEKVLFQLFNVTPNEEPAA
ncbi:sugar ABC transporter ATP-binding protein [Microterricola viridarii]|uniref:Monosaccharide ABC transporter ATP-binding protein, CUT2 family n=1 Tax=Microterricola viridarii TaxID=412690 RepID=A0A1H1V6W0_9MICO|nr:sugar ABC transporter ATP-binding protein [Microterricola viridarii]SDS80488.1 monosaccharide ABC transporter ATP-binding protein, CUT2 family [Microterricola viridarii]